MRRGIYGLEKYGQRRPNSSRMSEESAIVRETPTQPWWYPSRLFIGSKAIWVIMLVLMSISLWIVFSSTSTKAFGSWASGGGFFSMFGKHVLSMILSIGICVAVSHIPLRYFRRYAPLFLILSFISLIFVLFRGQDLNEAKRQISLFGISFQPSELARLALINFVATQLRFKDGLHASVKNFWIIFGTTILICGPIFKENISTALILLSVVFCISYIGGANRKWLSRLFWGGLAVLAVLIALLIFVPSIREGGATRLGTGYARIERFVTQVGAPIDTDTYSDIDGKDLQIVSSQRAIANSHLLGVGFGKSEMRNLLPEPYSDFVFSILVEEGGIAAAILVVLTYLALFFTIGGIGRRTNNVYQTLLVLGIGLIITLQAFLHMLICVNLFPITGQNLPFISRGGSSYLVTGIYFGILLAVSNDNKRKEEERIAKAGGMNQIVSAEAIPEMPPIESEPIEKVEP